MEYPLPLPAVLFGCLLPAQLAAAELSLSVTQDSRRTGRSDSGYARAYTQLALLG